MWKSTEVREQSRFFAQAAVGKTTAHAKQIMAGFAHDLAKLAEDIAREEHYSEVWEKTCREARPS